jgi:hypothetical protein
MTRRSDLDRLYELLDTLERHCGGRRRLADCSGRTGWPKRGVYFFFEPDEYREDSVTPRVVRVGTHGLRPSQSTLWGRLSQHKGSTGGTYPGGGSHRGSIFRLHVGMALLATGGWPPEIGGVWSVGNSASRETKEVEYPLERAVSDYIGAMPFLWVTVNDPPSPSSDRGVIEAGAIALLSNLDRPPIDPPSPGWLGRRAQRPLIRDSGLWNVDHVRDTHHNRSLDALEAHVATTHR